MLLTIKQLTVKSATSAVVSKYPKAPLPQGCTIPDTRSITILLWYIAIGSRVKICSEMVGLGLTLKIL